MEQLSDEAIEAILGQQLWKNGVYVGESLTISITIFQLKAIARKAEQEILRQVVDMLTDVGITAHKETGEDGVLLRILKTDWQELKSSRSIVQSKGGKGNEIFQ